MYDTLALCSTSSTTQCVLRIMYLVHCTIVESFILYPPMIRPIHSLFHCIHFYYYRPLQKNVAEKNNTKIILKNERTKKHTLAS